MMFVLMIINVKAGAMTGRPSDDFPRLPQGMKKWAQWFPATFLHQSKHIRLSWLQDVLKSPILSKVDASISIVANLHNSEVFLDADPQARNLGCLIVAIKSIRFRNSQTEKYPQKWNTMKLLSLVLQHMTNTSGVGCLPLLGFWVHKPTKITGGPHLVYTDHILYTPLDRIPHDTTHHPGMSKVFWSVLLLSCRFLCGFWETTWCPTTKMRWSFLALGQNVACWTHGKSSMEGVHCRWEAGHHSPVAGAKIPCLSVLWRPANCVAAQGKYVEKW